LFSALWQPGGLDIPRNGPLHAIDVGFGDDLITSVEFLDSLSQRSSEYFLSALECDEQRVRRASTQTQNPRLRVLRGTFSTCKDLTPAPVIIRVINVLRGYTLLDAAQASRIMARGLAPGGTLVEGTTDVEGHLASAHLWRKSNDGAQIVYDGLFVATNFARGFAPRMFRDVLPRDLRRHVLPGEPVAEWLEQWQTQADEVRQQHTNSTNKAVFQASAEKLADSRSDTDIRWLKHGCLLWRPPRPSHRSEVMSPGPV
jgi:hypothetical protein